MTFQEAVRTCFQKYLTISGRARRAEYWWWVLFVFLGNMLFGFVDQIVFGTEVSFLGGIFSLAVLLPSICVGGRRLHDRDMSAWWLLLMLVPVIGTIILLVIYLLPGTEGPNRFGPDPIRGGSGPADGKTYARSSVPNVGRDD